MLTLVTGPSGVGKSTVLIDKGILTLDFDAYVVQRFNLPIIEACTRFNANIDDEWDRYVDYIRASKLEVISDCAVTMKHRKRYLDTFGPMYLIYLTASLPTLLERNRTRGQARIPKQFILEKYFAQEMPMPWEGFMGVYLRSTEDGVTAYADEHSMLVGGGVYDMVVSEEEWAKAGYEAHRNKRGDIVLGVDEERLNRANAEVIRAERDIRLARCDKMSPMRWEDMTDEQRMEWRQYRHALLSMPDREGFPWGGVIDNAPWPEMPK